MGPGEPGTDTPANMVVSCTLIPRTELLLLPTEGSVMQTSPVASQNLPAASRAVEPFPTETPRCFLRQLLGPIPAAKQAQSEASGDRWGLWPVEAQKHCAVPGQQTEPFTTLPEPASAASAPVLGRLWLFCARLRMAQLRTSYDRLQCIKNEWKDR